MSESTTLKTSRPTSPPAAALKKAKKSSVAATVIVGDVVVGAGGGGASASATGSGASSSSLTKKKAKTKKVVVADDTAAAAAGGGGGVGIDGSATGSAAASATSASPTKKAAAAVKTKLGVSEFAGPDTTTMIQGPFLPVADMATHTASLPPRLAGIKVLSYNVNGLRSCIRPDRAADFQAWITAEDPDVFVIQEVRADDAVIIKEKFASLFSSLPYVVFAAGDPKGEGYKKGYAGVAIYSKTAPLETSTGLGESAHDGHGRFVSATFPWGCIVNVYVPNSGQKLERLSYRTEEWDPAMRARLQELAVKTHEGKVLILGDFNVAFQNADVTGWKEYRNKIAGFCDGERQGFSELLNIGFRDLWREANKNILQYSEEEEEGGDGTIIYFEKRNASRLPPYLLLLNLLPPPPPPDSLFFYPLNKVTWGRTRVAY